jgi:hypothetical protein
MSKEYALDLGDLKLIDVVCGKCNREMIVDLSLSQMPTACWSCEKDFERSFTEALSHLLYIRLIELTATNLVLQQHVFGSAAK